MDLKPSLLDASRRVYEESGGLLWWADETHWNGLGQKAAADAIQQRLLEPLKRGGPSHADTHAAPER